MVWDFSHEKTENNLNAWLVPSVIKMEVNNRSSIKDDLHIQEANWTCSVMLPFGDILSTMWLKLFLYILFFLLSFTISTLLNSQNSRSHTTILGKNLKSPVSSCLTPFTVSPSTQFSPTRASSESKQHRARLQKQDRNQTLTPLKKQMNEVFFLHYICYLQFLNNVFSQPTWLGSKWPRVKQLLYDY